MRVVLDISARLSGGKVSRVLAQALIRIAMGVSGPPQHTVAIQTCACMPDAIERDRAVKL